MKEFIGKKALVTSPPAHWGKDPPAARLAWHALESLGLKLFALDIGLVLEADPARLAAHIADIRAFAPDFAIATPNAGYAAVASVMDGGRWRNLIIDILEVPVLATWDSVVQFADQLVRGNLPQTPQQSRPGMAEILRRLLNHPLMRHVAYDRSQVKALESLKLIEPGRVQYSPAFAYQAFIDHGQTHAAPAKPSRDLAFTGSLWLERASSPISHTDIHRRLLPALTSQRSLAAPVWPALMGAIEALPAAERAANHLDPDHRFFWALALDMIANQAATFDRRRMLDAMRRPLDFFGRLERHQPGQSTPWPHVHYRGDVDMETELPALNADTAITVDIVNRLFDEGVTCKVVSCFAAGGFCLFDRRPDFAQFAGADAERVMFADTDEMNDKIEYFLTHPDQRRDLARHLRALVADRLSPSRIYADAITTAFFKT